MKEASEPDALGGFQWSHLRPLTSVRSVVLARSFSSEWREGETPPKGDTERPCSLATPNGWLEVASLRGSHQDGGGRPG